MEENRINENENKEQEEQEIIASKDAILEDVDELKKESEDKKNSKKKEKKKWYKYVLYLGIILIITAIVLGISLTQKTIVDGEEKMVYETVPSLFGSIFSSNKTILFFFIFIGTIILNNLLNAFNLMVYARLYTRKYKYHQALANHMVGVFYSNITPGSSGGQFAQAYTFKKQGIPLSTSASILVMSFIVYQSVLVVCGLISMIKINDVLAISAIDLSIFGWNFSIPVIIFIIGGYLLNAFLIVLLFLMSYSRKLHNFVLNHVINFLAKIHLIKKPEEKKESLRLQVENFRVELRRLQSNIPFSILIILLTFLTMFVNTSLPTLCGYALNAFQGDFNFLDFLNNLMCSFCYMNFHQMMTGLVPIPGSAGISEYVFNRLFTTASWGVGEDGVKYYIYGFFTNPDFGTAGLNTLMLLWRFGTFYIPFIISGIVSATYKSRGLSGEERFYAVDDSKKTFLTIQMETLDERKLTSSITYNEKQYERNVLKEKLKVKQKDKINTKKKTKKDSDLTDEIDIKEE